MLKLITSLIEKLVEPAEANEMEIDPLLHPALRCMSQRELADLPFGAMRKRSAGQDRCPA